ncbi:SPOR domain-containing protein [Azospirillum rugosum]|uniref:SPOR domain-containing protein n=1 Tax=Azospirillum rugosum TaxID=416170 RepID=A0ABS4SCK7_9PROT|nr:SPOR domain-containing protein [Azospirillum rugosum]MBP2290301.1 hypothetical protein [Azospirillum rugosum]MDQ0527777.1 hypothetical protein [Azospirillum rugosum]
MMTITLGRWQVAALAVSLFALVVVAVFSGFLLAAYSLAGASPSVASDAPAPSQSVAGGDLAAAARQRLKNNYEANRAIVGTADEVGDVVREGNAMFVDPVAKGAGAAARRFLPKWMSSQVARGIDRASFHTKEKFAYGVEDSVEGSLKDTVYGDGTGRAPAAPPRVYAVELGRFATPFNAESFAAAAAQRGVPTTVDYAPESGPSAAYAVRSGRYAAADEASAALDALSRSAGVSGTVVTLAEPGARPAP